VLRAYGRLYAIPGRDIQVPWRSPFSRKRAITVSPPPANLTSTYSLQGCVVLEKANLGDLHSWMIDNRRYLHDTQFISHFLDIVKGTRPRPRPRPCACGYMGSNLPRNMWALGVGVAAGMHYIHSSSPALIHGELKPSNILLFGHKFDLHGTPHYLGLRYAIDAHCT
jgi:serine/threonine protein kinase